MSNQIILTGHTKGIGRSLLSLLIQSGNFEVLGISRSSAGIASISELSCDLSNPAEVKAILPHIESSNPGYLILNAGANSIRPAESYSYLEVEKAYYLNLVSPALLIRACIPALVRNKGHLIVLGSFSALEVRRWNNYYGSAKAGLHHLVKNIFEQYRKQQVRVSLIVPDIVASDFYSGQDFQPDTSPEYSISPDEVARLIFNIIQEKSGYVPFEVVIRPQMFKLHRR
ncbi:MAG: SDR family oxidoreductase [Thermaurantimonas sp.]